jgi:hypothetical protein
LQVNERPESVNLVNEDACERHAWLRCAFHDSADGDVRNNRYRGAKRSLDIEFLKLGRMPSKSYEISTNHDEFPG